MLLGCAERLLHDVLCLRRPTDDVAAKNLSQQVNAPLDDQFDRAQSSPEGCVSRASRSAQAGNRVIARYGNAPCSRVGDW